MIQKILLLIVPLILLSACAANKPLLQRSWIGGEFANVKASFPPPDPYVDRFKTVTVIPQEVKKEQKCAVLVTRVTQNTPVSIAGIEEGDLIVRVNGQKIKSKSALRKCVSKTKPGEKISVRLFRKSEFIEKDLIVGKESYREQKYLTIGFKLGPDINIIPNPNFSIFSIVSFHANSERPLLSSPKNIFIKKCLSTGKDIEVPMWDVWLGIIGVGKGEKIISQEVD